MLGSRSQVRVGLRGMSLRLVESQLVENPEYGELYRPKPSPPSSKTATPRKIGAKQ